MTGLRRRPSEGETLALRRELLVASATLQRLSLARSVRASPLLASWHGIVRVAQLVAAWRAHRATRRWFFWGRLLVLLRDALRSTPASR